MTKSTQEVLLLRFYPDVRQEVPSHTDYGYFLFSLPFVLTCPLRKSGTASKPWILSFPPSFDLTCFSWKLPDGVKLVTQSMTSWKSITKSELTWGTTYDLRKNFSRMETSTVSLEVHRRGIPIQLKGVSYHRQNSYHQPKRPLVFTSDGLQEFGIRSLTVPRYRLPGPVWIPLL